MLEFLNGLITSGHIVDVALIFMAIEFAVLLARPSPNLVATRIVSLILALGPGACLMLALRFSLTGAAPLWVAFWLTASLPLHMWDVLRRRV